MVEGRDGEGRRMAEVGDYHCEGRRMAEGGDCHGQGRSMAEGGDCRRSMAEGLDATASQDCGPEEVVSYLTSKDNLLSVHTCGELEVTELRNSSTNTCPQSEEVDCPIQAKGLKKRQATTKGRRRIKGGMEKSIAKKKKMQSKQGDTFCTPEGQFEPPVAMGNICSQGGSFPASQGQSEPSSALGSHSLQGVTVYTPQGQSRPPFAMGSNYVEGIYTREGQSRPPFGMSSNYVEGVYTSQGQSRPPFGMSSNYVEGNNAPQSMPPHSMPLVYPSQTSFQELLRGTSAVQLSQASYSPGDSYVNGHPWKACTKQ